MGPRVPLSRRRVHLQRLAVPALVGVVVVRRDRPDSAWKARLQIGSRGQIMRMLRIISLTMVLMSALFLTCCGIEDRIDLEVTSPRPTLRVGETVQLSVIQRMPDGSALELTSPNTGSVYYTTGESMLIPEPDGRVTCIGTSGRNQESAIIGVRNGEHHGHIRLMLLALGSGPGLEVIVDKAILREGEKAQLHVFKSLPDGSRKEVTAASTGTRYLTFAGNAVADTSVVNISSTGLVLTTDSIGHFNYRTVVILVRNEDSVGWIVMTNRARKGWVSHHDIPASEHGNSGRRIRRKVVHFGTMEGSATPLAPEQTRPSVSWDKVGGDTI